MKQVIIVRKDIKMGTGKISAQVAHASLSAVELSEKKKIEEWREEGQKKVVLKVKDLDELREIEKCCRKEKLVFAVITDAGHTQVEPGTVTVLAVGPDKDEKIDRVTGRLKML